MTQRYVKTDYDSCSYIMADKAYELYSGGRIRGDNGRSLSIVTPDIFQEVKRDRPLVSRNVIWQWCNKDGNTLEGEK